MPQEIQLPVFCVPGRSARPVDFEESAQCGAVPSPLRFLLVIGSGRTCPHDFRFLGDAFWREVLAATSEQSVSIDRLVALSPILGGQSLESQIIFRGELLTKKYGRQSASSRSSDSPDDESKANADQVPIIRIDR
ncbi:hypothetical protein VFPBJ_11217 [Purpureocillium lilacinum]|uniref:Uncharacterized protein n=1 Tax=Purpureocillium lilacinum TaxID=33203 RepID=A0A179FG37_PURLI|nr:hypothetical protein VFPBJ_11217 [Purpureocillium lilacinum]